VQPHELCERPALRFVHNLLEARTKKDNLMHFKPMPFMDELDAERFWSHVDVQIPLDCWHWKLSTGNAGGYGRFKVGNRNLTASRAAYYLHYGIDPLDNLVCHTCDNPPCCNPYHLFLGTNQENLVDAREKGRLKPRTGDAHGLRMRPDRAARGERVHGARLTADMVRVIRQAYKDGMRQYEIAAQFDVTRETVSAIVRGKNWKHIAAEDETPCLSDASRRIKSGSTNGAAKLTEGEVREIKQALREGVLRSELAQRYHVSWSAINLIATNQKWKHVD
jgi:predicted DNA-binding protein (UPF0251 family)